MTRYFISLLLLLFCSSKVIAHDVEQRPLTLDSIDDYINNAIEKHYFPGAQLVIGGKDSIFYSKSYGYLDYTKHEVVDDSTIYDLASCTKVLATTLASMILIEEEKFSFSDRIGDLIPGVERVDYVDVCVRNLLYHDSGFRAGVSVIGSLVKSADENIPLLSMRKSANNPYKFDERCFVAKEIVYDSLRIHSDFGRGDVPIMDSLYLDRRYQMVLDSMINAAYNPKARGQYRYSDLNFYFLKKIIEASTSTPFDKYLNNVYERMGIKEIGFNPKEWYDVAKIAPTEYDPLLRRDTVRGVVHDELAFISGGVSGNAGLFGSARSVAQICGMFLRGGQAYNGNTIVNSSTIDLFTSAKRFGTGALHGLGFDKLDPAKTPYSKESYGHTGFTGTYLWIDPAQDLYVVLLTNRIHPSRANRQLNGDYRGKLWEMASTLKNSGEEVLSH